MDKVASKSDFATAPNARARRRPRGVGRRAFSGFGTQVPEATSKYRKAQRLSQEGLAERADLAPKVISLTERFERNFSVNVADSIAQGVAVALSQMIREAEELRPLSGKKETPARTRAGQV